MADEDSQLQPNDGELAELAGVVAKSRTAFIPLLASPWRRSKLAIIALQVAQAIMIAIGVCGILAGIVLFAYGIDKGFSRPQWVWGAVGYILGLLVHLCCAFALYVVFAQAEANIRESILVRSLQGRPYSAERGVAGESTGKA